MNNRRRFIRFKNPDTQIIYLASPGDLSKTFPALVQDESRNSISCVYLESFTFESNADLIWIEEDKHQTKVKVIREEEVTNGVHKLIFQFD